MSDCNTCGGATGSTPSGSGWVVPSNPCENEEVPTGTELLVDAPACDSVKTVHVVSGAPVENPCDEAEATVALPTTCGEVAVNALYDLTLDALTVPSVGTSLPVRVVDASRYWVGQTVVVGTAANRFWGQVVARDTTLNYVTLLRLRVTGSATAGAAVGSCSPVVPSTPGAGDDFCLFTDKLGESSVGDVLLFQGEGDCELPARLPSGHGFLWHNSETGAKVWVATPTEEGAYTVDIDRDGVPSFSPEDASDSKRSWGIGVDFSVTLAQITAVGASADGNVMDWTDPTSMTPGEGGHWLSAHARSTSGAPTPTLQVHVRPIGGGAETLVANQGSAEANDYFNVTAIIPSGYEFRITCIRGDLLFGSTPDGVDGHIMGMN